MLVMFVFLLSACIAGYALRGRTVALVQQQLVNTMELYGPDNLVVTKLWDEVQSDVSKVNLVKFNVLRYAPLNVTFAFRSIFF